MLPNNPVEDEPALNPLIMRCYGFRTVYHQPWQISIFHEDICGKFVYYPKRGCLMRRDGRDNEFKMGNYPEATTDTEDLIKILNQYLP